jgi:hypothetical protein
VLSGLGGAVDLSWRKSGGGREGMISTYDPFGKNLVNATLLGSGWTYHHEEINNKIHKIIK